MPANTTLRQQLHELADQLPANATWDDVIEEARFRKAVETGIAAADRGAFATNEEVETAFAKWSVNIKESLNFAFWCDRRRIISQCRHA